jgi:hypothetical protein
MDLSGPGIDVKLKERKKESKVGKYFPKFSKINYIYIKRNFRKFPNSIVEKMINFVNEKRLVLICILFIIIFQILFTHNIHNI